MTHAGCTKMQRAEKQVELQFITDLASLLLCPRASVLNPDESCGISAANCSCLLVARGDRRRAGVRVFAAAGGGRSGRRSSAARCASPSTRTARRGFARSTSSPRRSTAGSCGSAWTRATRSTAGKTLLTMIEPRDPDLLDARSVAQAEARVKAAEATLRQVEPKLEKARDDQALCRSGGDAGSQGVSGQRAFRNRNWKTPNLLYRQRSEELRSTQDSRKRSPASSWSRPRRR